jgi:hypothetical protein
MNKIQVCVQNMFIKFKGGVMLIGKWWNFASQHHIMYLFWLVEQYHGKVNNNK